MRFIVDGMLGGLARWLRILGHEVVYERSTNDSTLLDRARRQQMILLTGDKELYQRARAKGTTTLLVSGPREEVRIAEVSRHFGLTLDPDMTVSKCPECGTSLRKVQARNVVDAVAATSLRLYKQFWQCENPSCGKVYWMGSHWKQIMKTLENAKKLVQEENDAHAG